MKIVSENTRNASGSLALVWMICLAASGCGSGNGVAPVYGTVKYDGQPVEGAVVEFIPEGEARAGTGTTDENGYYDLRYTRKQRGAKVGKNKVKIYIPKDEDPETGKAVDVGILIPAKYNTQTELVRDVPSSGGRIDFDLKP